MASRINERHRLLLTDLIDRDGIRIDLVISLECADAINRNDADRAGTGCFQIIARRLIHVVRHLRPIASEMAS